MKSLNELWELVLADLKENCKESIYDVWFKELVLKAFDGDVAVLLTDGFRIGILLKQHFDATIQTAFRNVTGLDVEIEFHAKEEDPVAPAAPPLRNPADAEEESTFENFVVGPSNRFAYSAAFSVAEKPGSTKNYNPLFIYGNSGLGKTHLLKAISHRINADFPDSKIIFTRGEDFMNLIITGIRDRNMEAIREKFRNCDVLIVDDIQFISKSEATQEEFFHTFDALISENKQVVLSSDRPPREIRVLDDRLRSRFEWGLLADIKTPDLETRIAIIHRKAAAFGLELDDSVVHYLAENVHNNVRALEGTLKLLNAYSSIHGVSITRSTVEIAIKDFLSSTPDPITAEKIINEVSRTFGANPEEICSKKKDSKTATMRQIAMYLIRNMTGLSYSEIGEEFGGKDHTTVMHAIKVIEGKLETDENLRSTIDDIKKNVSE